MVARGKSLIFATFRSIDPDAVLPFFALIEKAPLEDPLFFGISICTATMLWGVKMPQHRPQAAWPGLAGRGGSRGVAEVAGTVIRAANIALLRSIDPELKRPYRKSAAQRPSLFRN